MKAGEYNDLATRTEAPSREFLERISAITIIYGGRLLAMEPQTSFDLVHGILGVVGEAQEYDRLFFQAQEGDVPEIAEMLKEEGDTWWYARLIARSLNNDIGHLGLYVSSMAIEMVQNGDASLCFTDSLSEPLKKWLFYGKPIDSNVMVVETAKILAIQAARGVIAEYEGENALAEMEKEDIEELIDQHLSKVWELNIEKLRRRFPVDFEAVLAQEHDSN